MFVILAVVVEGLTAAYWLGALQPRLLAEAESGATALAQCQSQALAEALSPIGGDLRRDQVIHAMDGMLLLVNPNTGSPFILGVELELDYDVVPAPEGTLDLARGEIEPGYSFVTEIPLYSPTTRELLGIARFHCSGEFFNFLRDDVRRKLFLGSGAILVLLALAWWGVRLLLRPLHSLSASLGTGHVGALRPLPELTGLVSEEILRVKTALDERFAESVVYTEQLQRQAAELKQRNDEVRQFAYIISHDLRAPLVNLKGFAAELESAQEVISAATRTLWPQLDENERQAVTTAIEEDAPEALGFISSSVTRMDGLVNALLKLSRLGRRELVLESIDMNELVKATLRTLAHQIEEGGVHLTVDALPEVTADRTAMEQILGNLLSNAVLYLDPERPGEIEVTAECGHGLTTIHVGDNGRGIARDDMEKVFAPFRRAGKQDVRGEGMGLAYVQALVRRHRGRIECESEPGVGTRFSLTLPNQHSERGDHGF
ncbi:MAG: HAMP domain-containing histidine kinase [bacterium]|nr:HAMP domain-containing histidine kinase [bacterium]